MVHTTDYSEWMEPQHAGNVDRVKSLQTSRKSNYQFQANVTNSSIRFSGAYLKDPYNFSFLALDIKHRENELEQGLMDHIQKFLLEIGEGFAFVGRQYRIEVEGEDYLIDLLFYHLKLRESN